ncbi:dihydroorotase [Aurantibacillus circumpalustris]|uniref:dihydroorotase n=1 Tax=Aurantibacillus circumpalustris TaxID=3036359 RepID=UPI00295A8838|nr:dihydroorotase [Aurantibacillus circumpalustris]
MNILIKEATIISSNTALNNKVMDILIEGGVIVDIKKTISPKGNVKIIEEKGLHVSAGWIDMQTASCDPGFEYKENLDTMIKCAAAGGFTAVCVHNYNLPALDNKSQIEYLINKTRNKIVSVLPFGTITVGGNGKDMAEMYDMKMSGAIAFSDYKHPIKDAGMVMRALQYADNIETLVVTHCNDESISMAGQMNEGAVATTLGLKGMPALAEELMVQRNLSILEYTNGRIHIPTISTKGSAELIKKAKSAGMNVTCGVAAVNLFLDDSVLKDFDTNYKLDPPLRTKKDVQALRTAVENGTIDVIVSDHLPQDAESKELEFDHADMGMINLQTAFNCALEGLKEKNIESIVHALTYNPRKILGIDQFEVKVNETANLTLFVIDKNTSFTEDSNHSRSRNSPFFGQDLKGKVVGILNGTKSFFN